MAMNAPHNVFIARYQVSESNVLPWWMVTDTTVYQAMSATQCPTRNAAPSMSPPSSPATTIALPMDNHQTQKKGFTRLVSTPDRNTCLIPLSPADPP